MILNMLWWIRFVTWLSNRSNLAYLSILPLSKRSVKNTIQFLTITELSNSKRDLPDPQGPKSIKGDWERCKTSSSPCLLWMIPWFDFEFKNWESENRTFRTSTPCHNGFANIQDRWASHIAKGQKSLGLLRRHKDVGIQVCHVRLFPPKNKRWLHHCRRWGNEKFSYILQLAAQRQDGVHMVEILQMP